jgi:Mrp family chromosome partitioning ATPase
MLQISNSELEKIYLRSLGAGMRSLAITSSQPGEGVSSLAVALVQRHLLAGKSALLVDLGGRQIGEDYVLAATLGDEPVSSTEPQLLANESYSYALLGIPAPISRRVNTEWRNPGQLEAHIDAWLTQFDAVVIDGACFSPNTPVAISAERIVAACEATLLVVMAGVTTEPDVRYSCQRIQVAGGKLAGCVLNERYNPSLKQEMLRESGRLPRVFSRLKSHLIRSIEGNRLLSLEI